MNNQQHQNMIDLKEEKQHESDNQNCSSNSSSPSHEFSFTISFQQTKQIPPPPPSSTTTTSSSSFAIDLSPADDIFFHGHLLPLHLLSHLPLSSPRSSTNSLDGFTLPKKDHFFHQEHKVPNSKINQRVVLLDDDTSCDAKGKPKTKSFSLFGISKWRKGYEVKDQKDQRSQQYRKKMTQVVKRYIKMVRPFLSFRNKKNMQFHSFSGNLLKGKKNNNKDFRGIIKEQYSSAPASIRTSPTNSGLLVATPTGGGGGGGVFSNFTNSSTCSSSDSTMEELQAAIQAAIAHCKKSISMED